MLDKDIDDVNPLEEKVFETYLDIAKEIEVQKKIWDEVKNVDIASIRYNEYLEKKSNDDMG